MNNAPSTHSIDLDAYFRRLGYAGRPSATLETLRALHVLHTQAIPFENLDPLLGRPVPLDLASIEAKLVLSRRGGYCYEHNLLFAHVLGRLGYSVSNLMARVLWGEPEGKINPRSHMLLHVQLDRRAYIADVGFGGNTLTAPLLIDTDAEQDTPHGRYRVLRIDGDYLLQARVQEKWEPLYRFDLTAYLPVDYEAVNYYHSTSDASHFRQSLYAALAAPGGRRSMLNGRLTIRSLDGTPERIQAANAGEAAKLLQDVFGIEVPDSTAFDAVWPRLG